MRGNVHRRLWDLEGRLRQHKPERSSGARERMKAHLDQIARLRRGELSEEGAADVRATHASIESRLAVRRSQGGG